MGLILHQGMRAARGVQLATHHPSLELFASTLPGHWAPHRQVLLFARFTSFWIKTTTRSVRMC